MSGVDAGSGETPAEEQGEEIVYEEPEPGKFERALPEDEPDDNIYSEFYPEPYTGSGLDLWVICDVKGQKVSGDLFLDSHPSDQIGIRLNYVALDLYLAEARNRLNKFEEIEVEKLIVQHLNKKDKRYLNVKSLWLLQKYIKKVSIRTQISERFWNDAEGAVTQAGGSKHQAYEDIEDELDKIGSESHSIEERMNQMKDAVILAWEYFTRMRPKLEDEPTRNGSDLANKARNDMKEQARLYMISQTGKLDQTKSLDQASFLQSLETFLWTNHASMVVNKQEAALQAIRKAAKEGWDDGIAFFSRNASSAEEQEKHMMVDPTTRAWIPYNPKAEGMIGVEILGSTIYYDDLNVRRMYEIKYGKKMPASWLAFRN